MTYNYLIYKAIHVIFVVSYFAGLFYIVRLMIYHTETQQMEEPKKSILQDQYTYMEKKLWNVITAPALVILITMGLNMLYKNQGLLQMPWMKSKLGMISVLLIYHFWCWRTLKQIQNKVFKYTSVQLRMMNELATILLFVIVFAVIQKTDFGQNWYWSIVSFFGCGILLMLIVRLINRNNKK
ncbi:MULTISPECIES: CopD family protein [Empedobacter]|uniref:Protoporphyrinogen IX oxidase n=1 Tax=Empedobacter falsenii TaxID=343874 RepID=A0A376G1Y7_9FLAO|nr:MULTISPECIES: CopD family protein [Empedobacter]MBY0065368.1 CopD family protein [Empedobacter falsenii]STD54344.1 Predicted membrane protein [Empedobacter falsenii]